MNITLVYNLQLSQRMNSTKFSWASTCIGWLNGE